MSIINFHVCYTCCNNIIPTFLYIEDTLLEGCTNNNQLYDNVLSYIKKNIHPSFYYCHRCAIPVHSPAPQKDHAPNLHKQALYVISIIRSLPNQIHPFPNRRLHLDGLPIQPMKTACFVPDQRPHPVKMQ